jgi:hypothetical protein
MIAYSVFSSARGVMLHPGRGVKWVSVSAALETRNVRSPKEIALTDHTADDPGDFHDHPFINALEYLPNRGGG